jgi:hypothetical protein
MGDKASSTDARGLRAQLEGLNSAEQQKVAYQCLCKRLLPKAVSQQMMRYANMLF